MFQWLKELYEIRRAAREESEVCKSCEVLKVQLERANYEREMLMNKLLMPTAAAEPLKLTPVTKPNTSRHIPFNVRRQILESEDREKARILREHADRMKNDIEEKFKIQNFTEAENKIIDPNPQVEEIERELGIK